MVVIVPRGYKARVLEISYPTVTITLEEDTHIPIVGRIEDKHWWIGRMDDLTIVFTDKEFEELEQEV